MMGISPSKNFQIPTPAQSVIREKTNSARQVIHNYRRADGMPAGRESLLFEVPSRPVFFGLLPLIFHLTLDIFPYMYYCTI